MVRDLFGHSMSGGTLFFHWASHLTKELTQGDMELRLRDEAQVKSPPFERQLPPVEGDGPLVRLSLVCNGCPHSSHCSRLLLTLAPLLAEALLGGGCVPIPRQGLNSEQSPSALADPSPLARASFWGSKRPGPAC